jgi:hypothetical protein
MAFLHYAKSEYGGQYWHALPREIAQFWRRVMVRQCQYGEIGRFFVCPAEQRQVERTKDDF